MRSATQILHAHKDAPVVDGCIDIEAGALCWVCGHDARGRGILRDKWSGADFVGQNRVRALGSKHVCEACIWAMSGRGMGSLRMESHLFEAGAHYAHLNKGQKPQMREFLRARHASDWFAAIADSGQKHTLPWCPVNAGGSRGGRVIFEEMIVTLPSDEPGWGLVDAMAILLTAGATKAEVENGAYKHWAWSLCADQVRAFETAWGGQRGSPFFSLAIWLAQRDEAAVAARMAAQKLESAEKKASAKAASKATKPAKVTAKKKGKNADIRANEGAPTDAHDGGDSRNPVSVSSDVGGQHSETLGSNKRPREAVSKNDVRPGGMVDVDVPKPSAGFPQLSLF